MFLRYSCSLLFFLFSFHLTAQPMFDSHLHYTADDAKRFTPQTIINLLEKNTISYAAIISTPSVHMNKLYQLAPDRIVPLLSAHHQNANKSSWTTDKTFISYLKNELERGYWKGIGELHIFARDRHSKVFQQVIVLASTRKLPLLIHGDPAVIDTIYEIAPKLQVVWAHAGTFPYPDLLSDYLRRYPNLLIDVSMRDERIATDGIINDEWYELFVTYPNRFMIGVDTYSTSRWGKLSSATGTIRSWLAQLPDDIAVQLAFLNAAKLYKKPIPIKEGKGSQ